MSGAPNSGALTSARLTAQLAVEFCVPMITGAVQGQSPVAGHALTPEARAQLGITEKGATVMYPLGEDSVLLDMSGSRSTLWFVGADCVQAAPIVDAALRAAFPAIRQIGDDPNPQTQRARTRGYTLELGGGRVCTLEMGYPLSGAEGESLIFVLRINALQRQAGAPAATPQPEKPKKKGLF